MAKKRRADAPDLTPDSDDPLPEDDGPPPEPPELVGPPAPPDPPVAEVPVADSPAPTLAVDPPVSASPAPAPPPAPPVPVAAIVAAPDPWVEDRLRKMEQTLAQLLELEQRLASKAGTPPAAVPAQPEGKSLLASATALIETGAKMIPGLSLLTGEPRPNKQSAWMELVAELRAMQRMFVDPRYSMSWIGRFGPPVLLGAFVFTWVWVPLALVPVFGWLLQDAAKLVIGYALFKVIVAEARRYREKAPDLPPSLRL